MPRSWTTAKRLHDGFIGGEGLGRILPLDAVGPTSNTH